MRCNHYLLRSLEETDKPEHAGWYGNQLWVWRGNPQKLVKISVCPEFSQKKEMKVKAVWNRNRYEKIRKCLKNKDLEKKIKNLYNKKKKNIFQIAAEIDVPVPVVRKFIFGKLFDNHSQNR